MNHLSVTSVLKANAAFSALSGLGLIVGWTSVSDWLGVPTAISVGLGLGLLVFAGSVYRIAQNPAPAAVKSVILSDLAWVVGAAAVLVLFPDAMTTAGRWALGLVSLIVADFALLQWLALGRTEDVTAPGAVA